MEQLIKGLIDFLKDQFAILTGENISGDKIITASGAAASYKGNAKRIILLVPTQFTSCRIEYEEVAAAKGYDVIVEAPAVLSPGRHKTFTSFTIADGGQVQVIE